MKLFLQINATTMTNRQLFPILNHAKTSSLFMVHLTIFLRAPTLFSRCDAPHIPSALFAMPFPRVAINSCEIDVASFWVNPIKRFEVFFC